MSNIKLSGNPSGTGSLTIAAPNTNSDYTLTLPAESGTLVTTGGAASSLSTSGNLTFTGTGNRITGDFSNATFANRVMFQTSTVNGNTTVSAIPNGTGSVSQFTAYSGSDPANASGIAISQVGATESRVQGVQTGSGSYSPMTFFTGGSERMRIDTSGNVGIGTSSPSAKLTVNDANGIAIRIGDISAAPVSQTAVYVGGSTSALSGGNGDLVLIPRTSDARSILFYTGNGTAAERLRIDSSGNVGIGTSSPSRLLQLNSTLPVLQLTNPTTGTTANDGTLLYQNAANFTIEQQDGGYINLLTGGSERMRIDSSGNVGIGTTSPAAKLQVVGNTVSSNLYFGTVTGSAGTLASDTGNSGGRIVLWGSTSPGAGLIQIGTNAAAAITFETSNTERARIDSSGNLLVGTTSADAKFVTAHGLNNVVGRIAQTASSGITSDIFQVTALNHATSTSLYMLRCYTSGPSAQFAVRSDGVVYAQNTAIQSISDARVKENVRNSEEGLQTVLGLRPVRFDFKEGFGNNRKNQLGFIAQEVEAVFPDAVDAAGEEDEQGEPYKSVGPGAMIPVLVKAIQEQQAIIQTLTTRIAALEAK